MADMTCIYDDVSLLRIQEKSSYDFTKAKNPLMSSTTSHPVTIKSTNNNVLVARKVEYLNETIAQASKQQLGLLNIVNPGEIGSKSSTARPTIVQATTAALGLELPDETAYNFLEMIKRFDLLPPKKAGPIVTVDLSAGTGSWTLLVALLRPWSKKDNYFSLAYKAKTTTKRSYDDRVRNYFKTRKGWMKLSAIDFNRGDLTDYHTVNEVTQNFTLANYPNTHLILADGRLNDSDDEAENFLLIYGEIVAALAIAQQGSHFVIRTMGFATKPSQKLLAILAHFYANVYIYKPSTIHITSLDRYVVCKGFKYKHGEKSLRSQLDAVNAPFYELSRNRDTFCLDLFTDLTLSPKDMRALDMQSQVIQANRVLAMCIQDRCLNPNTDMRKTLDQLRTMQMNTTKKYIRDFVPQK